MLFRENIENRELELAFGKLTTANKLHDIWLVHLVNEREKLVKDWVTESQLSQKQVVSASFFAK